MSFIQQIMATPYGAFTAIILVFVIGEIVTKVTKGFVPMAFTSTVLLLACFWLKIFPVSVNVGGVDIQFYEATGVGATIFGLCSALLIINLGTLINRKEMAAQWKTIVISLMGLAAICVIGLTIGRALYGKNDALAATPVLAGAAMAVALVKQAAAAIDLHAYLIAVVVMAVQGIFGYPLVSFCLKKEAKKLAIDYREGRLEAPAAKAAVEGAKAKRKDTTNMVLVKMGLLAILSWIIEYLTAKAGFKISMYVWAMVFGFIGHEIGFLGDDCLSAAGCNGFCLTVLMIYLFGSLAGYTAAVVLPAFLEAAIFVVLAAAGMALMAFISSKIFKKSFWICWAIALNAFLGFPINVMITNEALEMNTEEGAEREAVKAELMPQMLVASFISVTIVSVIIAGVLVSHFA